MKLILATLLVLFGASYSSAELGIDPPPGCTRIEYNTSVFTYTALVDGTYTFKGGSVGSSENAYLITVFLVAGETWTVPEGGAAISYVDVCPTEITTTTTLPEETTTTTSTTVTTTSTLLEPCEHPILKDPAVLQWPGGGFKIHGRLAGPGPVNGLTVTLETAQDGVFLEVGCVLDYVRTNRWSCVDDDARALLKLKKDGSYSFRVSGFPTFTNPTTKLITTKVYAVECVGTNTGEWLGRIGDIIKNRF